uniref:Uncharacterized protein n=1 Tax=Caenorhabditis japonica TaxID=281687 RepID=A0A8R1E5L9_CAEJA
MHPSLPISGLLVWFSIVIGIFGVVGVVCCLYILIIEPCTMRRRSAHISLIVARFNQYEDTMALLSRCHDGKNFKM